MVLAEMPNGFNWYDVVWMIALLYGLWDGIRMGLFGEIARIVGWILILWISINYYIPVGAWIKTQIGIDEEIGRLTAFVMLIVTTYVLSMLLRRLIRKWTAKVDGTAFIQNVGGGIAGVIRMTFAMIFLTILVCLMRSPFWHQEVGKQSQFGSFVVRQFPAVQATVNKQFPETFIFFKDIERPDDINTDPTRELNNDFERSSSKKRK